MTEQERQYRELQDKWKVNAEERGFYSEAFNRGEGVCRDETAAYFERDNAYPIRVTKDCDELYIEAVPFVGY